VRPDRVKLCRTGPEKHGDTDWLLPFLVHLADTQKPECFVVDQAGPAATMLAGLIGAKLSCVLRTTAYKAACAQFVDAVKYQKIVHRGQQPRRMLRLEV
jgi:hypothetical protein